jgi:hypothetical protein
MDTCRKLSLAAPFHLMTQSAETIFRAAISFAGAGLVLIGTALPASALIACNKAGECWHVHDNYVYRPEFGVTVHPDNWHCGRHDHCRWREHLGRGYWHNGVWITF